MAWTHRYRATRHASWHHYTGHRNNGFHHRVHPHRGNYSVMKKGAKQDYAALMHRQPTPHENELRQNGRSNSSQLAPKRGDPHHINISHADGYSLAKMLEKEAGGEDLKGQYAMIWSVLNRAAVKGEFGLQQKPGESRIHAVLNESKINKDGKRVWQFSAAGDFGGVDNMPKPSAQSIKAVLDVITGREPDPTGGRTFYQNVGVTALTGTEFSGPNAMTIGKHTFYSGYGKRHIQVPQNIVLAYAQKGKGLDGTAGQNAINQAMGGGQGQHHGARRRHHPNGFADRRRRPSGHGLG